MNLIGAIWSALGLLAVASLFANPSPVYGAAPQYYSPSSDNITRGSLISRSALGEEQHLPLVDSDVSITITGQIARVQVSQQFENPTDEWIEGERPAEPLWRGLTVAGTLNRVERRPRATTHRDG